jgi:glyoxylase-like metal-dependent hydrolase (beta-lactamase superfamily II)
MSQQDRMAENTFAVIQILERDNFSYLLRDRQTGESLVIDPGYPAIYSRVINEGIQISGVFHTHGHSDHTGATPLFIEKFKCPLWAVKEGTGVESVSEGTVINFGRSCAVVKQVPGHTPDSAALQAGNCLFTGDALFLGTFGYAASPEALSSTYQTLYHKIASFNDQLLVFSGHDYSVEDLTLVHQAIGSAEGLEMTIEKCIATRKRRGAMNTSFDDMIISSVRDEKNWNLAYNLDNPGVKKMVAARGLRPGESHFEKYRGVQFLVNAS